MGSAVALTAGMQYASNTQVCHEFMSNNFWEFFLMHLRFPGFELDCCYKVFWTLILCKIICQLISFCCTVLLTQCSKSQARIKEKCLLRPTTLYCRKHHNIVKSKTTRSMISILEEDKTCWNKMEETCGGGQGPKRIVALQEVRSKLCICYK